MKSRLNGSTAKQSLVSRTRSAGTREVLPQPHADAGLVRAQVELVRVQQEHKTLRTWAICGTIVAGMAIISYAAVQRHRGIFE
jgi:hypothetical protein